MPTHKIPIGDINIEWSEWTQWDRFKEDARQGGLKVPSDPGVYEARLDNSDARLTIGKAADLRMRVKQGLVKGKIPHTAGDRIRDHEDTTQIIIRWANTSRPACVEEFLHQEHQENFGSLPKYVSHT